LRREKFRKHLSVQEVDAYVAELALRCEPATDPPNPPPFSPDPDDDYLVALTRKTDADALVSGDTDLTDLDLPDLTVLSARQLLDRLGDPKAEQPESGAGR
jgi:predicted nucleic acid-binding protein